MLITVTQEFIRTIPVISPTTLSVERAFSGLRIIIGDDRTSLTTENLSRLLFMKISGRAVNGFNPGTLVEPWDRTSADGAPQTATKYTLGLRFPISRAWPDIPFMCALSPRVTELIPGLHQTPIYLFTQRM